MSFVESQPLRSKNPCLRNQISSSQGSFCVFRDMLVYSLRGVKGVAVERFSPRDCPAQRYILCDGLNPSFFHRLVCEVRASAFFKEDLYGGPSEA